MHAVDNGLWALLPTFYTGRIVITLRHVVPLVFVSSLLVLSGLSFRSEAAFHLLSSVIFLYLALSLDVHA